MVLAVVGTSALTGLLGSAVASAHNAGRVELLVTNLGFTPMGHGLMVRADLIDRDSGAPAAGFAIDVSARGGDGAAAGPVTLSDSSGTGHYEGMLSVGAGSWTITAKAEQGTSALPALGSTRTTSVKLDERGALTQGSHRGGSDTGVWVALAAGAAVLLVGAFLLVSHRTGSAPQGMGQRAGV